MPVGTLDNDLDWTRTGWRREFILWPRRCSISNKLMWLTYAYYGWRYVLIDIGRSQLKLTTWHNEDDHLLYLLTNQD